MSQYRYLSTDELVETNTTEQNTTSAAAKRCAEWNGNPAGGFMASRNWLWPDLSRYRGWPDSRSRAPIMENFASSRNASSDGEADFPAGIVIGRANENGVARECAAAVALKRFG